MNIKTSNITNYQTRAQPLKIVYNLVIEVLEVSFVCLSIIKLYNPKQLLGAI